MDREKPYPGQTSAKLKEQKSFGKHSFSNHNGVKLEINSTNIRRTFPKHLEIKQHTSKQALGQSGKLKGSLKKSIEKWMKIKYNIPKLL